MQWCLSNTRLPKKGLLALFLLLGGVGVAEQKRGGNLDTAYGIISLNESNFVQMTPKPNMKDKDIARKTGEFIEVMDLKAFKTFQDNDCLKSRTTPDPKTKQPVAKNCPQFEWSVPYLRDVAAPWKSPTDVSEEIAKTMLDEWQTFQDRVHWKTIVAANNRIDPPLVLPAHAYEFYPTFCGIGSAIGQIDKNINQGIAGVTDINNPKPNSDGIYDRDIDSVYKEAGIPDKYNFDRHHNPLDYKWNSFSLWPQGVPVSAKEKICSGVGQRIDVDSLFTYTPMARYCLGVCLQPPGWPGPLFWWRWNTVRNRALQACNTAAKGDYIEYLRNVGQTLLQKMPLGLAWDASLPTPVPGSRGGVYFAPVGKGLDKWNFQQLTDMASDAGDLFAYPYFFKPDATQVITTDTERKKTGAAGAWKYEELKRWLTGGNQMEQHLFGFSNLFQVYQQTDTVLDTRPAFYYFHTVSCTGALWWYRCWVEAHPRALPNLVMYPGGCQFAPGEGGFIAYVMPRFHYRYVTVPEGLQIPWIQGKPAMVKDVLKLP